MAEEKELGTGMQGNPIPESEIPTIPEKEDIKEPVSEEVKLEENKEISQEKAPESPTEPDTTPEEPVVNEYDAYMDDIKQSDPDLYDELKAMEKDIEAEVKQERRDEFKKKYKKKLEEEGIPVPEAIKVEKVEDEKPEEVDASLDADFSNTNDKIVSAKEVSDEDVVSEDPESSEETPEATEETEPLTEHQQELEDTLNPKWSKQKVEDRKKYLQDKMKSLSDDELNNISIKDFSKDEVKMFVEEKNKRAYDAEVSTKALQDFNVKVQEYHKKELEFYNQFTEKAMDYIGSLNGSMTFDLGEEIKPLKHKFDEAHIDSMTNLNKFQQKFLGEDGRLDESKIPNLTKALYVANNFERIIKSVIEQTEAETLRKQVKNSKNIDFSGGRPTFDANDSPLKNKAFINGPIQGNVKVKPLNL